MSCGKEKDYLGHIVGESEPLSSSVLLSPDTVGRVRAGSYVVVESRQGCLLGMVERLTAGSTLLSESATNFENVRGVIESYGPDLAFQGTYVRARVKWLSVLDDIKRGVLRAPKQPPLPGSSVYLAERGDLTQVFAPGGMRTWIRLGQLESGEVEYRVDASKLFRHLAILAVTGGGKSNTVCVIARSLVKEIGISVVVFDMHGEYGTLGLGETEAVLVRRPGIHPLALSFAELARLADLGPKASNQRRILRWAWKQARRLVLRGDAGAEEFVDLMKRLVEEAVARDEGGSAWLSGLLREGKVDEPPYMRNQTDSALQVVNRLDDILDAYGDIISPSTDERLDRVIWPGRLTVFDLSSLDENGADAVVSHYLRRLLHERKASTSTRGEEGYPLPTIVFVEEAHVLIPRERDTLTKEWAKRIAREGRKFGLGLALVSQRPKNVDQDVLSQTNNKIILRMVEPDDIRYVRSASEELSEDLASLLPGLNPGEAVVIGSMTRLPALVHVDRCPYKRAGGDVDLEALLREREEREKKPGGVPLEAVL